jgi:small subunit ribosomal protein S20
MPTIKQAKKRMRQDEKRKIENRRVKSRMKTAIKVATSAFEEGVSKEEGADLLSKAYKAIDKANKKNLVHHNNAARRKSSLAKGLNKAPAAKPAE